MPISNYAELQAAIADWLNRDDLTAVVPSFISLAEADINRTVRDFRMENKVSLTVDAQYESLPADWVETTRIQLTGSSARLDLASDAAIAEMRADRQDISGKPTHYLYTAGQIEFFPTPDIAYTGELVYVAKVPTLSASATTNWLLTAAPDVYLYGALVQSAPYLKDDARAPIWAGLYQSAVTALNAASEKSQTSGASIRLRNRGMA